jgi:DNA-binding Lrp family transcriptional regulator
VTKSVSRGGITAPATSRRYLSTVVLNSLAHADATGQHPTDLYALNILELNAPLTAGALAAQTGLTAGAATRLIDRLAQRDQVRRVVDPNDRRRILIDVIPTVTIDTDGVFGPIRRHLTEVFVRFSAEQLRVLFEYFEHAATAFQNATEENRRRAASNRRPRG